MYGSNLDSLMSDLNFRRGEDISNRDFQKQLAQMDIETAVAMANAAMRDESQKAMLEAGVSLGTQAAGANWSGLFGSSTPDSNAFAPVAQQQTTTTSPGFDVTGGGQFSVTGGS